MHSSLNDMGQTSDTNPQRRRNSFLQPKSRTNWKGKGKKPESIPTNWKGKGKKPDNGNAGNRNPARRLAARRKVTWMNDKKHGYQPPRLHDLQFQNRLKASSYFPRRFIDPRAPGAPLNTTSYLMRAKKSGGIASLVSPTPPTPAIIPTPVLSPAPRYRGGLVEEANEEWGVNGYGSMNGLIRLRSSEVGKEDDDSESDVEQAAHVQSVQQLEQRLDQDLSRFVITYPSGSPQNDAPNLLETRMDDQDSHIAHLEDENITLKERLYLMQQEVEDLRRRLQILEGGGVVDEQAEASSERSTADVSCL